MLAFRSSGTKQQESSRALSGIDIFAYYLILPLSSSLCTQSKGHVKVLFEQILSCSHSSSITISFVAREAALKAKLKHLRRPAACFDCILRASTCHKTWPSGRSRHSLFSTHQTVTAQPRPSGKRINHRSHEHPRWQGSPVASKPDSIVHFVDPQ